MLRKHEYKILKKIRNLDGGYYVENDPPAFIDRQTVSLLKEHGCLDSFTLEPYRDETPNKAALIGIRVSFRGDQEMLLFEKEASEKRWSVLQFITAIVIGLAAIPEIVALFNLIAVEPLP